MHTMSEQVFQKQIWNIMKGNGDSTLDRALSSFQFMHPTKLFNRFTTFEVLPCYDSSKLWIVAINILSVF